MLLFIPVLFHVCFCVCSVLKKHKLWHWRSCRRKPERNFWTLSKIYTWRYLMVVITVCTYKSNLTGESVWIRCLCLIFRTQRWWVVGFIHVWSGAQQWTHFTHGGAERSRGVSVFHGWCFNGLQELSETHHQCPVRYSHRRHITVWSTGWEVLVLYFC